MSRAKINAICAQFPGAEVSDPWGPVMVDGKASPHDAWKVGGKMFACIGSKTPGVSLKTDSIETAQMLIEVGVGRKAAYFHRSWVNLPFDADEDELRLRIGNAYKIVRGKLPKKLQTTLPPYPL